MVTGNYNFDSLKRGVHQDFKMGLVNATGKVIVPLEFDVIGNPSMVMNNSVEVTKDGKVGYFDLSGKEIIPAAYQWLVSYTKDDAAALVAKDSLNGWLDHDFHFHENFPSDDAKRNIEEFQYLVDHTFTMGHNKDLINVIYTLKEEYLHSGNGLIIPSAFLVKNGIFPQIYDGFVSSSVKGFL